MSEFFDQICGFLESDQSPLCTSWLANSLNISTIETVQVLNQFVKHYSTKSDLQISYLLTGYDFSNRLRVAVVSNENVSNYIDTNLRKSLSNTIFSISKVPTDSFQSHVVDSCLQLADTLLHTTSSIEGSFLTNGCGDICLAGLSVKPVGERIFSSQNVQLAKSLGSTGTKPSISQSKSSSNSLLGKTSAPVAVVQPSDNEHYETLISSKSKLSKGPIKHDDDEEWDDGDSPAIGRKRTPPVITAVSPTKCVEQENIPLKDEETTKKAKVTKRNTLVRGGMDDFMDDIAIEQFKFQQQHPESSQKKTKKVLVEKVINSLFLLLVFIVNIYHSNVRHQSMKKAILSRKWFGRRSQTMKKWLT